MTREHTQQQTAPAKITPTEAIRRAMTALGSTGEVSDILAYIRDHFGLTSLPREEDEADGPRASSAPAPRREEKEQKPAAPEPAREALPRLEAFAHPEKGQRAAPPAARVDLPLEGVPGDTKAEPAEPPPAAGKKPQGKRGKSKD